MYAAKPPGITITQAARKHSRGKLQTGDQLSYELPHKPNSLDCFVNLRIATDRLNRRTRVLCGTRHHRGRFTGGRGGLITMSTADAALIALGERFERRMLEYMDAWLAW